MNPHSPALGSHLLVLSVCFASATWWSSQTTTNAASPAEEIRTLIQDYRTAQAEYGKLLQGATTPEQREKLRQEKAPDARKVSPRLWHLAENNPKDLATIDALVWLTTDAWQTEEAGKALLALGRDHATSDKVASVCQIAPYISAGGVGEFLRAVLEKNPNRETQAAACQSLYSHSLMANPTQAEKYLDLLAGQYASLKSGGGTLGDFAKTEQELNKTFGIGKTAPEIEGEDIDGKKFRLSDYRGKVVVIDFWGDW